MVPTCFPKEDDSEVKKCSDELDNLYRTLLSELPEVKVKQKNMVRNNIDASKAHLLCFFTEIFISLYKRKVEIWENLNVSSRAELSKNINVLVMTLMKRQSKISVGEIESFELELRRTHRLCDLLVYLSSTQYLMALSIDKVRELKIKSKRVINSFTVYNNDQDEKMKVLLGELKEKIRSSTEISDAERAMINDAMKTNFNSKTGHWFKCKNNHIYCITECGGAVVERLCPVNGCGANIGGRNYTLNGGQTIASEMYGTRHAARFNMNKM